MKITAVVPIRKGSQRVKDKNLRPFSNTTLLENKIETLLQVPRLDSIIVNTNSEEAIELVQQKYYDTKVSIHRREEYYASSQCTGSEFFEHLGKVTDTDVFLYAPCTSPFISVDTISKCIQRFFDNNKSGLFDCVSTVTAIKEFMWLNGKAINYDPQNAPNSQNLPDVVALNFGTTIISKDNLINNRNIIGKKPDFVLISDVEAIDIDTPLDFYLASQIHKRIVVEGKKLLDD